MFKVVIEKPEPQTVKLSRKNQVHVTIVSSSNEADENDANDKLLAYYLAEQNVTWAGQFKAAILLGP